MPNGILYIAAVLEKQDMKLRFTIGFIDERKPEDFVELVPSLLAFR